MRIVVTGATGFLGQPVVARLLREGHAVTALGRDREKLAVLAASGARAVRLDLRERSSLYEVLRGHDAVIHSAALCTPWAKTAEYVAGNVRATEHVVDACERVRVPRLVHVSTPSIFAERAHRLGVRENDPLPVRFVSAYARTKWEAERVVQRAAERGLRTIVLRPQGLYGPGDPSVLPRLLRAGDGRSFPFIEGGRALVDMTYIDDAVESVVCALRHVDARAGAVYHVTSGDPQSVSTIVRSLFAAVGASLRTREVPFELAYALGASAEAAHRAFGLAGEPRFTRYTVLLLGRSRTLDISRARAELDYVPRTSLSEGLESFARSWRTQDVQSASLVPRVGALHAS